MAWSARPRALGGGSARVQPEVGGVRNSTQMASHRADDFGRSSLVKALIRNNLHYGMLIAIVKSGGATAQPSSAPARIPERKSETGGTMFSVAMLSILLSAAATASLGARTAVAQAGDPAVKVSLNHRTYDRGDRARVNVKVRDDGYVVVLQLRADGLVRVLYPLDPGNDDFVRGNQSYEVRGRGDREAFTVESANGTGTVYAAWSAVPFNFANFVRGDHWDYGVIGDSALPRDPETGFTNLVQRMAGGQFQYDLVSYSVQGYVASAAPNYYATAGYSSCAFDPWCDGYGYGSGYGYGYAPYGYAPYGFAPYGFAGSCFGASIWAFGFGPCYAFSPFGYYPYRYNPYGFGFGYPFGYGYYNRPIVVINNVPFRPYRWKGGGLGGGGVIGVPYRPRNFASTTSPIG